MSMNSWTEGTVDVNGIPLHYHRTGSGDGKPQLLALHGMSENGLSWTMVAKELEPEVEVIMPDARGHGKSVAPSMDFTLAGATDDVVGLMRALGLRQPMLLGHSMGALMATAVAARHPELVSKLVLEDAPFSLQKIPFMSKILVPSWLRGWKKNDDKTPEQLRREGKAGNPTWSDEELDLWVNGEKAFARNLKNIKLTRIDFTMDWASLLPHVTCPVLLISPSRGILQWKAALRLAPRFSGTTAEIARIENAGHVVHRDQFGPYMAALKAFCTR